MTAELVATRAAWSQIVDPATFSRGVPYEIF